MNDKIFYMFKRIKIDYQFNSTSDKIHKRDIYERLTRRSAGTFSNSNPIRMASN